MISNISIGNAASFNTDDGFSNMKNSSESSENPSRPVSRYVSINISCIVLSVLNKF
jgi:hypothetical protein